MKTLVSIALAVASHACTPTLSVPEPRPTPTEVHDEEREGVTATPSSPAPAPCPRVALADDVSPAQAETARTIADAIGDVFERLHRREDVRDVSTGGQNPAFDARESALGAIEPPDVLCPVGLAVVPAELPVVRVELRRADGASERAPLVTRRGDNGRWLLNLEGLAASYTARRNLRRIASLLAQSDDLPELDGVHVQRLEWPSDVRPHPELTEGIAARSLARTDVLCLRFGGTWRCTEPAEQTADSVSYTDVSAMVLDAGTPAGSATIAVHRSTESQLGEVFRAERSLVVLALDASGARRIGYFPLLIEARERTLRGGDRYSDRAITLEHEAYEASSRCMEVELEAAVERRSANGGPATRARPRLRRAPSPWDGHDPHGEDIVFDWGGAWRLRDDGSFERVEACPAPSGG